MRDSVTSELRVLESLIPRENGLSVFDAETQETSYGIWFLEGLPFIFDTHRSRDHFVATIELLTEVVEPIRISSARVRRFCEDARDRGILPIPYSGCFFRENLHVYAFSGPVRGFDLAAVGRSARQSERRLQDRLKALWASIPSPILHAQQDLLRRRRRVRHSADLEVLTECWAQAGDPGRRRSSLPRTTSKPSRL